MTTASFPSAPLPVTADAGPSVFAQDLAESFARAAAATREEALTLRLAGRSVRIVFAGDALVPFVRGALAPRHSAGDGPPDLTLKLWDTRSTGVSAPLPPGAPPICWRRPLLPASEQADWSA